MQPTPSCSIPLEELGDMFADFFDDTNAFMPEAAATPFRMDIRSTEPAMSRPYQNIVRSDFLLRCFAHETL